MALPRVRPWHQQLRSPLSLGAFVIIASTTALLGWTHLRSTAINSTVTSSTTTSSTTTTTEANVTTTQEQSTPNQTVADEASTASDLASEPGLALGPISALNATNQAQSTYQTPF